MEELSPPTKVVVKFLRTWADRDKTMLDYSHSSSGSTSLDGQAKIALSLSRRLNHVLKVKKLLAIESGLEMIALAMIISSEVRNINVFESLLFIFLP